MRNAFTLAAVGSIAALALTTPVLAGGCEKPYVRKEWRELKPDEQRQFIKAVKCLGNKPHTSALTPTNFTSGIVGVDPNSSLYDDFVYAHMDTNVKDHFTGLFLPWHRWYLTAFEKALKKKCGYKGALPYWDWSLDVADVPASPVFSSDPKIGFGKFGTSSNNYTITDGAFADVIRAYPNPHVLARNWEPQPFLKKIFPLDFKNATKFAVEAFTPKEVKYIIENFVGDYVGFAYYLDGVRAQGMHNAAHLMMLPGDISNPSFSPNDPLFYLHHANLDRIWASWQRENPKNANAYGGGSIQNLPDYDNFPVGQPPYVNTSWTLPTSGLEASDPKVAQVMSTTGGYLCFNYSKYKV